MQGAAAGAAAAGSISGSAAVRPAMAAAAKSMEGGGSAAAGADGADGAEEEDEVVFVSEQQGRSRYCDGEGERERDRKRARKAAAEAKVDEEERRTRSLDTEYAIMGWSAAFNPVPPEPPRFPGRPRWNNLMERFPYEMNHSDWEMSWTHLNDGRSWPTPELAPDDAYTVGEAAAFWERYWPAGERTWERFYEEFIRGKGALIMEGDHVLPVFKKPPPA